MVVAVWVAMWAGLAMDMHMEVAAMEEGATVASMGVAV